MLEAGWLMIKKAAFLSDSGENFLHNASMAKLRTDFDDLRAEVEGMMGDGQASDATVNEHGQKMLQIIDRYHTGREEPEPVSEPEPAEEPAETVEQ